MCIRILKSMASNALEKSTKTAKVTLPLFIALSMLPRSLIKMVNLEWIFLYPDWSWWYIIFFYIYNAIWRREPSDKRLTVWLKQKLVYNQQVPLVYWILELDIYGIFCNSLKTSEAISDCSWWTLEVMRCIQLLVLSGIWECYHIQLNNH